MSGGDKRQFIYVQEGLALAEKLNWMRGMANLHNDAGLMVGDSGNNTLARKHFLASFALNNSLNSPLNLINNLNNIGRSYQRESDFSNATDNFFKALSIAEKLGNEEKIALVGTNITSAYITQKNYPKAIEYAAFTLKYAELSHAPDQIGKALLMTGVIKAETKDTPSAKVYLQRALQIYANEKNRKQEAAVLANLASLEFPDYEKVVALCLRAQTIFDETGPAYIGSIGNLVNLGSNYYQLGRKATGPKRAYWFRQSEACLVRSADLCKQTANEEYLATVYLSLSDLGEARMQYKSALDYHKLATGINDSLFSQDRKNTIAGLESRHNLAVKDQEIALNHAMLVSQRKTQVALGIGLLLAGVIGAMYYRQAKNRKKTNTTLLVLNNRLDEANKIKSKFFGILSHDLRSPISSLLNFLNLLRNEPDLLKEEEKEAFRQEIAKSAEDLLQTMEAMLLWSKEQMANFKPDIKFIRINTLFEYLNRFFASTSQVSIQYSGDGDLEVLADENYLKVIMQNLTSNAIKAVGNSPDAAIQWNASMEKGRVVLSITDNGPGINADQAKSLFGDAEVVNSKTGFGHHLIRDLAKAIRYQITVDSTPGMGATFHLIALS